MSSNGVNEDKKRFVEVAKKQREVEQKDKKNQQTDPSNSPESVSRVNSITNYHQLTKHRLQAYARGPETLDWDNQPNPFRYFNNSPLIPLSLTLDNESCNYSDLIDSPLSIASPQPINYQSLSTFFRTSFGLTAWKEYGPDKWSLRVNPSSGNLHPTEVYCLLDTDHLVADQKLSGLFHYQAFEHALEARATGNQPGQLPDGFLLIFSSVLWRESWKYGERAYRYCQLDMGHALSCASFAARALGWRAYWLPHITGEEMSRALGLNNPEFQRLRAEEGELAEACVFVSRTAIDCRDYDNNAHLSHRIAKTLSQINHWMGEPNELGEKTFYRWPEVDKVANACDSGILPRSYFNAVTPIQSLATTSIFSKDEADNQLGLNSFNQVVLHRRSAQRFTKQTLSLCQFKRIVAQLINAQQPLLGGQSGPLSQLSFVFLIHDVEGLLEGLYVLPSAATQLDELQHSMDRWPNWQSAVSWTIDGVDYSLYQLKVANFRKVAGGLCCHQAIAVDCNFTVGYLARFEQPMIQTDGALYRSLFWQAGSLAQQIYLAATFEGIAATGIGCFFDDAWHEMLGITDQQFQFVYQMAVGHPIVDQRIANYSGYHHLKGR